MFSLSFLFHFVFFSFVLLLVGGVLFVVNLTSKTRGILLFTSHHRSRAYLFLVFFCFEPSCSAIIIIIVVIIPTSSTSAFTTFIVFFCGAANAFGSLPFHNSCSHNTNELLPFCCCKERKTEEEENENVMKAETKQ